MIVTDSFVCPCLPNEGLAAVTVIPETLPAFAADGSLRPAGSCAESQATNKVIARTSAIRRAACRLDASVIGISDRLRFALRCSHAVMAVRQEA